MPYRVRSEGASFLVTEQVNKREAEIEKRYGLLGMLGPVLIVPGTLAQIAGVLLTSFPAALVSRGRRRRLRREGRRRAEACLGLLRGLNGRNLCLQSGDAVLRYPRCPLRVDGLRPPHVVRAQGP
jgi:hypothetical protein